MNRFAAFLLRPASVDYQLMRKTFPMLINETQFEEEKARARRETEREGEEEEERERD